MYVFHAQLGKNSPLSWRTNHISPCWNFKGLQLSMSMFWIWRWVDYLLHIGLGWALFTVITASCGPCKVAKQFFWSPLQPWDDTIAAVDLIVSEGTWEYIWYYCLATDLHRKGERYVKSWTWTACTCAVSRLPLSAGSAIRMTLKNSRNLPRSQSIGIHASGIYSYQRAAVRSNL